ncbi:MAG: hypothetical protein RL745_814, partial [Actinomycetota bacterium]
MVRAARKVRPDHEARKDPQVLTVRLAPEAMSVLAEPKASGAIAETLGLLALRGRWARVACAVWQANK